VKTLRHNGVYIPKYNPVGLSVYYRGRKINLSSEAEQMAIAFTKKLETDYVKDEVFVSNFLLDFRRAIGLDSLTLADLDFSPVKSYLDEIKLKISQMTKEERKLARELKRRVNDNLREKYGYAVVDGKRVSIMNWRVEPPSIYLSKGKHPLRGRWKPGIREEDITLNLSPDAPTPEGWKGRRIWKPNKLFIAYWRDPLKGKIKYVMFSPTSPLRQGREREKWNKASSLKEKYRQVWEHILRNLDSEDRERRELATAVYFIAKLGLRVGDERNTGETGNVGCTTLRKENISLQGNRVVLDFIGKDFVPWRKEVNAHPKVVRNLERDLLPREGDLVFPSLDSKKISKFLQEVVPGCTAKVFRTYLATSTFKEASSSHPIDPSLPEYEKKYILQSTLLQVAKTLNHQRKPPRNWEKRLKRKEERVRKLEKTLETLEEKYRSSRPKERVKVKRRMVKKEELLRKAKLDLTIFKATRGWNLNTARAAYVDPRVVKEYCERLDYPIEKVYSKSLREKYSWCLRGE